MERSEHNLYVRTYPAVPHFAGQEAGLIRPANGGAH